MKIHTLTLITLLFVLTMGISYAQTNLDLGIKKQFIFSENAAFLLDFNTGEVALTIPLQEEPMFAVLNENQQVIYLMSAHYIFKVDANSGNKIDEFMFAEKLEKWTNETNDPNQDYHQKGITKNGLALFEYNKERRKVMYNDPYALNMTTEIARTMGRKTYFTANIETKSISPYIFPFDVKDNTFKGEKDLFTFSSYTTSNMNTDGIIKVIAGYKPGHGQDSNCPKARGMIDYNIITKKIDENSFRCDAYDFSLFENYSSLLQAPRTPIELSDTTTLIPVTFISPDASMKHSIIFCEKNSSKVLAIKDARNFVILRQFNCNKHWSATKEIVENQPSFHPPAIYFEFLKSFSPKPKNVSDTQYEKTLKTMMKAKKSNLSYSLFYNYAKNKVRKDSKSSWKKRFKKITQEMDEYYRKLDSWHKHDLHSKLNINLFISDLPNSIILNYNSEHIPGNSLMQPIPQGTVYNDNYYLVKNYIGYKMSGYTMYDLTTGKIVYTIDLDF